MTNSTLSNNSANSSGGGFYSNYSIATLTNSTLSNNSATIGGGISTSNLSFLTLNTTLIAGNQATNAAEVSNGADSVITAAFNLFGDSANNNTIAFANFTPDASNITATSNGTQSTLLNQILSPLADNGGNTLTHGLVVKSPARDAGNSVACPNFDQISQRRNDGACDIGAFEFQTDDGFIVIPLGNGRVVVIPN